MATIMCLPDEIIAIVLGYNDISSEDIMNFRCMWKQFPSTAKYDIDWERIFSQRWPSAKKLYDKQSRENEQKDSEENEQKDKKSLNFIETGINCARLLRDYVSQIIYKYYYEYRLFTYDKYKIIDNSINFEDIFHLDIHRINFDEIFNKPENLIKYYFFIDEIKNLLTQSPRRIDCDLTKRYCNLKIFHHMRQCLMRKKWDRFEEQPDREQLIERTGTIVAQWIQPQKDVFYSYVKASLDSIAREVLNCLREEHPDHSIFSTSAETFSYWKNNNIDNNHWNKEEGMQIVNTLENTLDKLNFRPIGSQNLEHMCIDNVLKNKEGHEIILLIIYHSVARRLGLRCDIIGLQYRSRTVPTYSIVWKPNYATNSLENTRCFSLSYKKFPDGLVDQQMLFEALCSRSRSGDVFVITAKMMWREMKDLFADVMNQYYNILDINPHESKTCGLISRKVSFCFNKIPFFVKRSEDVKFAVGMIVTHRVGRYDRSTDSCAGVIIGWHRPIDSYYHHVTFNVSDYVLCPSYFYTQCEMPLKHCDNFHFTKRQTNYIILTENNEMCYVVEDDITLTTPKWIDNSEIGRYFCRFEGMHYVPNEILANCYPQDATITAARYSIISEI